VTCPLARHHHQKRRGRFALPWPVSPTRGTERTGVRFLETIDHQDTGSEQLRDERIRFVDFPIGLECESDRGDRSAAVLKYPTEAIRIRHDPNTSSPTPQKLHRHSKRARRRTVCVEDGGVWRPSNSKRFAVVRGSKPTRV